MKYYPLAILVAILLAVLIAVLTARNGAIVSGRLGGDFPAFYTAGKLVVQGESHSIYDPERMLSEQQRVIPSGGYLSFVNPPHFAYFYALFGVLPFNFAFLVHFLFLVFLLAHVVKALISIKNIDASVFFFVLVASLTYYPLLKSVLGGQNSVISLFLLFSVWKFVYSGREWLAGICLGLLLYKPQFAIPFIGLFLLAGYWRVAISGIFCGICIVFSTVVFLKHDLLDWLTFVLAFSQRDADVNKLNSISFLGVVEAISGGINNEMSLSLAVLGTVIVVISISVLWYRGKAKRNLNELMAAACPAVLLIPEHVMYYDLSLCVLSVLLLVKDEGVWSKVAPILWLFGFTQEFSFLLGFSPLFLVVLIVYICCFRFAWLQGKYDSVP